MIDLTTYRLRIGTFGGGKPWRRTTRAKMNTSSNSVSVAVFLLFVVSKKFVGTNIAQQLGCTHLFRQFKVILYN